MARLVALFCAVLLAFGGAAQAEEKINRFEVDLEVERDADIIVTETITVTAEHQAINRGIFRDLPRYYRYEDGGQDVNLPYDYKVLGVERNGRKEPYETEGVGNAYRIRIGDPDVIIPIRSATASRTRSAISRTMTRSTGTSPAITGSFRSRRSSRVSSCPKARTFLIIPPMSAAMVRRGAPIPTALRATPISSRRTARWRPRKVSVLSLTLKRV